MSFSFRPSGAKIYLFSPSSYCTKAISLVLFGSYSIPITLPRMPVFSLLKSTARRYLLCSPPWCRTETRPETSRPDCFFFIVLSFFIIYIEFTEILFSAGQGCFGGTCCIKYSDLLPCFEFYYRFFPG